MLNLFFSLLLIVLPSISYSVEYTHSPKEGYWWYKDPLKEPQKEEEPPEEEQKQSSSSPQIKPLKEYSYKELLYMHPNEFKPIFEHYKDLAVMNPTEENLWNYYNILDVLRKKALLFTQASMYFLQKYPEFGEIDIPLTNPAKSAQRKIISQEISNTLKRTDYGLLVFVQPNCGFCEAQLRILKRFGQRHNIPIKVIDITQDSDATSLFGIESTPTIIVVSQKDRDWFFLSSGVLSLDEIEERVFTTIKHLEGEKLPEQWGLYDFQKGGGMDPTVPSPLWREEINKK